MTIRPFLPTGGRITPMQLLIFIQLLEGSKYGYEILMNLRDDFEGTWVPKTGTVYPALKTLVRKGFVSEAEVENTTYYSLTKEGMEFVQDTTDFVRDYVLFNYQFMTVAAERLPTEFTMSILVNFLKLGIEDIIPEQAIIEATRKIQDAEIRKSLLIQRKRILLDKSKLIRNELQLIEDEGLEKDGE
ncbi:MAG: PadR family transcriptional regulator [Candidatus Thorarchaeota archaeon]|nr:PadR family transcriptional regulator [Candidatus Thorarchaeota archaeon]